MVYIHAENALAKAYQDGFSCEREAGYSDHTYPAHSTRPISIIGHAIEGFVALLQMEFELSRNFLVPYQRSELATSGKVLAALRAPPRNGIPVNLLYDN